MQCHAIVLDTTGTTHARQQPRHTERDRKRKTKNEKNGEEEQRTKIKKYTLRGTKYPEKYYEQHGMAKQGKTKYPEPEETRLRSVVVPSGEATDKAKNKTKQTNKPE